MSGVDHGQPGSPDLVEVQSLLLEGLDLYGRDQVDGAVERWQRALALDPTNAEALDYLRTAGAEVAPPEPEAPPPEPAVTDSESSRDPLSGIEALVTGGMMAEALELLESLAPEHAQRPEVQTWHELLRADLLARFRERVGDGRGALRQKVGSNELLGFNLPSGAGFLLSMVDGMTATDDLVSVSGMDPFDALRMLHGLVEAGIVERAS